MALQRERDQARGASDIAGKKLGELQQIADATRTDLARARADRLGAALTGAQQERDRARSVLDGANKKIAELEQTLVNTQRERDLARTTLDGAFKTMADLEKTLNATKFDPRKANEELERQKPALGPKQLEREVLNEPPKQSDGARAAANMKLPGVEVTNLTEDLRRTYGIMSSVSGVVIVGVEGGYLPVGHVITRVDRTDVATVADFRKRIEAMKKDGTTFAPALVVDPRGFGKHRET
jgi:chromosome segregation ATPase